MYSFTFSVHVYIQMRMRWKTFLHPFMRKMFFFYFHSSLPWIVYLVSFASSPFNVLYMAQIFHISQNWLVKLNDFHPPNFSVGWYTQTVWLHKMHSKAILTYFSKLCRWNVSNIEQKLIQIYRDDGSYTWALYLMPC